MEILDYHPGEPFQYVEYNARLLDALPYRIVKTTHNSA